MEAFSWRHRHACEVLIVWRSDGSVRRRTRELSAAHARPGLKQGKNDRPVRPTAIRDSPHRARQPPRGSCAALRAVAVSTISADRIVQHFHHATRGEDMSLFSTTHWDPSCTPPIRRNERRMRRTEALRRRSRARRLEVEPLEARRVLSWFSEAIDYVSNELGPQAFAALGSELYPIGAGIVNDQSPAGESLPEVFREAAPPILGMWSIASRFTGAPY